MASLVGIGRRTVQFITFWELGRTPIGVTPRAHAGPERAGWEPEGHNPSRRAVIGSLIETPINVQRVTDFQHLQLPSFLRRITCVVAAS
jgi:hypothetical protein